MDWQCLCLLYCIYSINTAITRATIDLINILFSLSLKAAFFFPYSCPVVVRLFRCTAPIIITNQREFSTVQILDH